MESYHTNNTTMKDLNVSYNYVSGHVYGITIVGGEDSKLLSNVIDGGAEKVIRNGIVYQSIKTASNSAEYTKGFVIINENTIKNTHDRAIRMGFGLGCEMIISNNIFVDAVDGDYEVLKTNALTESSTFAFINNTYNGIKLQDREGTDQALVVAVQ